MAKQRNTLPICVTHRSFIEMPPYPILGRTEIRRPLGDHRRVRCFPSLNPYPGSPVRSIWRGVRRELVRGCLGPPGSLWSSKTASEASPEPPKMVQESPETPKDRSKMPKMGPRRPQRSPRRPMSPPRRHRRGQNLQIPLGKRTSLAYTTVQPLRRSTSSRRPPKPPQDGPKGFPEAPKMAPEGSQTVSEAPKTAQEDPKTAPREAQEGNHEPKIRAFRPEKAPAGPKRAPRGPKKPPRDPQDAPKMPSRGVLQYSPNGLCSG